MAVREKSEELQTKPKLLTLCVVLTFFSLVSPPRLAFLSWVDFHGRSRSLALLSLRMGTTRSIPKGWTERSLL